MRERLFDLFDQTGQMWYWALRCVQCGDIVDSLILKHRADAERTAAHAPLARNPGSQGSEINVQHTHVF